ncbi:MAG: hypothetical protein GXO90_10945 [FCB group bacterium]|nr:hypothetical protein [FCB group bacterium]
MLLTGLCSAQPETERSKAGRRWLLGDQLPDSTWAVVTDQLDSTSEDTLVLVIFTRQNHPYSFSFMEALGKFLPSPVKKRLSIVEVITPSRGTVLNSQLSHEFPLIDDTSHILYDQFGVRVFPTLFVVSPKGKLLHYLPGFTPTLKTHLSEILAPYFPDDLSQPISVHYTKSDKKRIRKEDLARKLYFSARYDLARFQLETLDSLTSDGIILLGMTYLKLESWNQADSVFRSLPDQAPYIGYRNLGRGLVAYRLGAFDQAWDFLSAIGSLPEMYRVHYWRGIVAQSLHRDSVAVEEYKKSAQQAAGKQAQQLLP